MTSYHKQLSTELDKYKDCDPERLSEVREWHFTVARDDVINVLLL